MLQYTERFEDDLVIDSQKMKEIIPDWNITMENLGMGEGRRGTNRLSDSFDHEENYIENCQNVWESEQKNKKWKNKIKLLTLEETIYSSEHDLYGHNKCLLLYNQISVLEHFQTLIGFSTKLFTKSLF